MKKIITSILTVLLVLCLFPSWTVRAQEIESFDVVVNDYYKEKDTVLKLYMESEEIMVSLDDLIKLTGYKSEKNENGFRLYRNGKNVLISNETIIYGNHKEEIKVVEYDEKTLVSLIPTIDFLDARLKMNDDSLVMFRPEMTFSKVLSEMKHDLDIGYMRIKKNNSLGTGAAQLELFLNGEYSSISKGERIEKVVLSLMTNDDLGEFELNGSDYISNILDTSNITMTMGQLEGLNLSYYDNGFVRMASSINKFNDAVTADYAIGDIVDAMNYQYQIMNFYEKNIDNCKNTILNGLYREGESVYSMVNKYVEYFESEENDEWMLAEHVLLNQMTSAPGRVMELVLTQDPAIAIGLSVVRMMNSVMGMTDKSMFVLSKQDYYSIQCRVATELNNYHNRIANGHVMTSDEITYYVSLARLYYHIASKYYKTMSELLGDKTAAGNYRDAQEMVERIDSIPMNVYQNDDPTIDSSKIMFNEIKEVEATEEQLKEIEKEKLKEILTTGWWISLCSQAPVFSTLEFKDDGTYIWREFAPNWDEKIDEDDFWCGKCEWEETDYNEKGNWSILDGKIIETTSSGSFDYIASTDENPNFLDTIVEDCEVICGIVYWGYANIRKAELTSNNVRDFGILWEENGLSKLKDK